MIFRWTIEGKSMNGLGGEAAVFIGTNMVYRAGNQVFRPLNAVRDIDVLQQQDLTQDVSF
jgi:hypothetical protein